MNDPIPEAAEKKLDRWLPKNNLWLISEMRFYLQNQRRLKELAEAVDTANAELAKAKESHLKMAVSLGRHTFNNCREAAVVLDNLVWVIPRPANDGAAVMPWSISIANP